MMKFLRRAWRYLVAALSGKLDEMADPKVQIEQAIEEAKRQHELLSQQAAAVLGNRRQLEMKLGRSIEEVEKLQSSARQALILEQQARAAGDEQKATSYEQTAQTFATKLVGEEASMKDLKGLHDQALQAAEQARKAVEQNAFVLQKRLAERSRLLSQLEQAKMQERMNDALKSVSELTVQGDVPTLSEVRDKIEERYARALGTSEITSNTVEARMVEVEKAALDSQGAERLEEIRKSLGSGTGAAASLPAEQSSEPAS
ncbi:MAG TPA: PspA/IM30 family protein [Actinomycetota bacterium]